MILKHQLNGEAKTSDLYKTNAKTNTQSNVV